MFGDVLRERISSLRNTTIKGIKGRIFWMTLRDIAADEIRSLNGKKICSDDAIAIYYMILKENVTQLPDEVKSVLPSNNQEKFRVINRNIWSSNAFHRDGLANIPGIFAKKELNEYRKGFRIIYQWRADS